MSWEFGVVEIKFFCIHASFISTDPLGHSKLDHFKIIYTVLLENSYASV